MKGVNPLKSALFLIAFTIAIAAAVSPIFTQLNQKNKQYNKYRAEKPESRTSAPMFA